MFISYNIIFLVFGMSVTGLYKDLKLYTVMTRMSRELKTMTYEIMLKVFFVFRHLKATMQMRS